MLNVRRVVKEAEERFEKIFGRQYTGLVEKYKTDDADFVIITLGTLSGLVQQVVDEYREAGIKAGLLRIRYMRPFPDIEIAEALSGVKAVAVLEKYISFGAEGTVYTNVNSVLKKTGLGIPALNYIGGLGGKDISIEEIKGIFRDLGAGVLGSAGSLGEGVDRNEVRAQGKTFPSKIHFLGIPEEVQND